MHFTFITRCMEPTNLQQIKNKIAEVFSKQTEHSYTHLILVDLTHGEVEQHFKDFADDITQVHFVHQKNKEDRHICEGVDKMLENYSPNFISYVYMLDDDNLIKDNFLDIVPEINPETDDIIIFRVQHHPYWGNEDIIMKRQSALGVLDWSCVLTKLTVMKQEKVFNPPRPRQADGRFVTKLLLKKKYNFKFSEQVIGCYNILRKHSRFKQRIINSRSSS